MNEMIGQILTLARADSDKPAVTELVDLDQIVRRVASDTDYEAASVRPRGSGSRLTRSAS